MNKIFYYDIIIIGSGVVGNSIARELSKYELKIAVLEKELDTGFGISCRNSGVIHSGIHYKPGTLRAELCVKGNTLMTNLCNDLGVQYNYIGKLTVANNDDEIQTLYRLKEQGELNNVPGMQILNYTKMQKIQKGVVGICALYTPSTGIVNPYQLTIALAENAYQNGVEFYFDHEVINIDKNNHFYLIKTKNNKLFKSRIVINAGGLYCDEISAKVGNAQYKIYPCKGEYYVLDKRLKDCMNILIYPVPGHNASGLGIHLTNTIDGNILIGPSNEYVNKKNQLATTMDVLKKLKQEGHNLLSDLSLSDFIRTFTGIRPKQAPPKIGGFMDFVIEEDNNNKGFINLIGIESPGLTSSPAIALKVVKIVKNLLNCVKNKNFKKNNIKTKPFKYCSPEERQDLIAQNKLNGEIFCRCESVTKQEIIDAINSPIGITTLNSIKYRTRVMMGRCQGGFCLPKITNLLLNEFNYTPDRIFLKSRESNQYCNYLHR